MNKKEIKNFLKFAFGGFLISQLPTIALSQIMPYNPLNELLFVIIFSVTVAVGLQIACSALADRIEGHV